MTEAIFNILIGAICGGTIVYAWMRRHEAERPVHHDDTPVRLLPGEPNVIAVTTSVDSSRFEKAVRDADAALDALANETARDIIDTGRPLEPVH